MNQYQTTDIFFASFLIASGYSNLKDIQDKGSGRKTLIFEPAPSQAVILGFYNGSDTVSAIRLFETFQSLNLRLLLFTDQTKKPMKEGEI